MYKNRIGGGAGRGERAKDREAPMTKGRRRKPGGRAVKDSVLTWGDLASCPKGRRRKAEREVSRGRSSGANREGPNEEESESTVGLGSTSPQKSRQLELPLKWTGEARLEQRSEEAPTATHGDERSGTSGLLELVLERQNLQAALKRVRKTRVVPASMG
jgi:hypothetical protein